MKNSGIYVNMAQKGPDSNQSSTVTTVGRTIILMGTISEGTVGDFFEHLENLTKGKGGRAPIKIKICSGGGDVSPGFAIYDILRSIPNEIIMEGYGEVSSIAALIYLAGDIRLISKECRWMAHRGDVDFGKNELGTMINLVKEAEYNDIRYVTIIAERTGQPLIVIQKMVQNETFIDAQQCINLGIAHHIIKDKNED